MARKYELTEEIFEHSPQLRELEGVDEYNELLTKRWEDTGKLIHPKLAFVLFMTHPPCEVCMEQAYILKTSSYPSDVEIWYVDIDKYESVVESLVSMKNLPEISVPKWFFFKGGKRIEFIWNDKKSGKKRRLYSIDGLLDANTIMKLFSKMYLERYIYVQKDENFDAKPKV